MTVTGGISLCLTGFARDAVEARAERLGLTVKQFLARAAEYYIEQRATRRPSHAVPRFVREARPRGGGLLVEVALEAKLRSEFERCAALEGLPVEELLRHAALLLAADLDA